MPALDDLYQMGVTLRQGQLIMLAGYPGSAKSAFTLWLCNEMAVDTLYLSADTSPRDMTNRLGAMATGFDTKKVEAYLADEGPSQDFVLDAVTETRVDFIYDDSPTLGDVEEELAAYVEAYDKYPSILVLDNLIDMDLSEYGGEEFQQWREALLWLKSLVRETGITVIVLHHARELAKSDWPAPRKEIHGKPTQTPEIAFTCALTPDGLFRLACVKQRNGFNDPMARVGIEMSMNPSFTFSPVGRFEKVEEKAA